MGARVAAADPPASHTPPFCGADLLRLTGDTSALLRLGEQQVETPVPCPPIL